MGRLATVPAIALVFLGVVAAPTASAEPILSLGGSYSYSIVADGVGASVPPQVLNSTELAFALPTIDLTRVGTLGSVATLEMRGTAAHGELKGFVETSGDATGASAGGSAGATGFLEVGFFDTLIVGHETLSVGAPVTFEYTGQLHSTLSFVGPPNCDPGATAQFIDLLIMTGAHSVGKTACGDPMPDHQLVSQTLHALVGDEIVIAGRMRIRVAAAAYVGGVTVSSATGNAANTASFFVTPVTPGATFRSVSGASYSAPAVVPEPASLLLLGAGLLAALGRQLRR